MRFRLSKRPPMSDDPSTVPYALVVDSEALILMVASAFLEEAGFRTLSARNGDEALARLAEHGEDVVLLFTGVRMPGSINGFELAHTVTRRWPHIGILVASGGTSPRDGDMPAGARFVRKPFSAEVIYDRIHELLPDGKKPEPLKVR